MGFILHHFELHFISGKANLGQRTNNLGEFKGLFNLPKIVVHMNISDLQVFRDSKLVIDWRKREAQVTNPSLHSITLQLHELSAHFNNIGFTHIRRDFNNATDALSKDALLISENCFVLEEFYEGDLFSRREGNIFDL